MRKGLGEERFEDDRLDDILLCIGCWECEKFVKLRICFVLSLASKNEVSGTLSVSTEIWCVGTKIVTHRFVLS